MALNNPKPRAIVTGLYLCHGKSKKITARLKKSPICHGKKPMKPGNKRNFKIPVTNVTIWPPGPTLNPGKKITRKNELAQDCAGFFCASSHTRRRQGLCFTVYAPGATSRQRQKSPNEEKKALTGFYLSAKAFPLRGLSSSPALRRLTAFVA